MKTCRRFSPVVRTAMKSGAKKRPRKRLQGPETKRVPLSKQERKTGLRGTPRKDKREPWPASDNPAFFVCLRP